MPAHLRVRFAADLLVISLVLGVKLWAQPAPPSGVPAAVPVRVSAMIQPALNDVQSSISGLNIARWKAPGEVKNATRQNADSIQRDLANTLPGLISQADAAPGAVSPAFSVYRNVDALYDVLLRVYGTASLAASQGESDSLFSALQKLESSRSELGDAILKDSQQHEAELIRLQTALKAATAVPPQQPQVKESVIDDGPAPSSSSKKKKKPAAKPPSAAGNSSGPTS